LSFVKKKNPSSQFSKKKNLFLATFKLENKQKKKKVLLVSVLLSYHSGNITFSKISWVKDVETKGHTCNKKKKLDVFSIRTRALPG